MLCLENVVLKDELKESREVSGLCPNRTEAATTRLNKYIKIKCICNNKEMRVQSLKDSVKLLPKNVERLLFLKYNLKVVIV